jgi:hypothetical protein
MALASFDRKGLLGAVVLLLTACAAPQPPGDTTAPSAMAPQQGGTFQTVGLRPLEHLNPWTQSTPQNATFYLNGSVYDQLVDNAYSPDEDHRAEKALTVE